MSMLDTPKALGAFSPVGQQIPHHASAPGSPFHFRLCALIILGILSSQYYEACFILLSVCSKNTWNFYLFHCLLPRSSPLAEPGSGCTCCSLMELLVGVRHFLFHFLPQLGPLAQIFFVDGFCELHGFIKGSCFFGHFNQLKHVSHCLLG